MLLNDDTMGFEEKKTEAFPSYSSPWDGLVEYADFLQKQLFKALAFYHTGIIK